MVVPTRNSEGTLRSCLESIRNQSSPCLIVVVDNGSVDSTISIAKDLADYVLDAGPERSAQRNAGAFATSERIVGFIDSDMVLTHDVVKEVVEAIDKGAASVIVPENTIGEGFWAKVSAYERSFYLGVSGVQAARFFRRDIFTTVGGFDEEMTGAEDWDLGIRTKNEGPCVRIIAQIIHQEGRVRYLKLCRKKAYYAPGVMRFLGKHRGGGLAEISDRVWLQQPRLLLNPLGVGLLALKIGEIVAMGVAITMGFIGRRVGRPNGLSIFHKAEKR